MLCSGEGILPQGGNPLHHHPAGVRIRNAKVRAPSSPSSTVTLVPSSGSCRLLCPGKEQEVARDCIESSCCRERLGSRQPVEEIDIRTQL